VVLIGEPVPMSSIVITIVPDFVFPCMHIITLLYLSTGACAFVSHGGQIR